MASSNVLTAITRRFKPVYTIEGKITKKDGGWMLIEGLDEPASVTEKYDSREVDPTTKENVIVERSRTVNYVPWTKLVCFRKDGNAAKELKVGDICTFYLELDIGWDAYNKRPEIKHWLTDYERDNDQITQPQTPIRRVKR